MVARDAFGFSLNYFTGDYKPVDAAKTPFATIAMNLPADPVSGISTGHQLFNGNIGAMAVNITKFNKPLVYGYRYDQLNRIVRMDAFDGLNNAANTFTANRLNDYHEEVSYDPNGNIRTYLRNATTAGSSPLGMDNLAYTYTTNTNKLKRVTDAVSSGNYTEDIDNQSNSENYVYDAIGNLIEDKAEGIDSIHWTVYGKIKRIVKGATTIDYTYDAAGNRISKAVTASAVTKTTYYVRDASGNLMSIYQAGDSSINSGELTQTEVHLYGSSRLGIFNVNNNVLCAPDSTDLTIFTRGNKLFELSNHLGNVLVTISDKKIVAPEYVCGFSGCGLMFHHYEADVVTANDYYPFGMLQPGRKYTNGSGYRYGFNGKENDNEVKGEGNQQDYGMRIYDARVSRFLSVDPITAKYPELTPYQFASNRPIDGVDQDGLEWQSFFLTPEGIKFTRGFVDRGKETAQGIYNTLKNEWAKMNNYVPAGGMKPEFKQQIQNQKLPSLNEMVKDLKQIGTSIYNDYKDLIKKTGSGDSYAAGALTFEIAMLLIPGGSESKAGSIGGKFLTTTFEKGATNVERITTLGLVDGMKIEWKVGIEMAENFLGEGYTEVIKGRFISKDGSRVVRMGEHELSGKKAPLHLNFETLEVNPAKPGKLKVKENIHVYLKE